MSMDTGAIEQLEDAIMALTHEDVAGGVCVNLGDGIIVLERLRSMLDAECARRLVAFHHSVEWSVDGSRSVAGWVAKHSNANKAEVAHRVHVGQMVALFDLTRAAWTAGEVTTSHVNVIAKTRSGARADSYFRAYEPELVNYAKTHSPKETVADAREWRSKLDDLLDRDPIDRHDEKEHQKRTLHLSNGMYGTAFLDGYFDAENAELIRAAIGRAFERGHREQDPRTPAQQRADAFAEICRSYLAGMPASGNRPHVALVVDINTYMGDTYGGCHTHRGDPINVDTARRIMCDSDINLVLANGLIPLAMGGTTRIFTTYQYRAMVIRDGGCRRCGASPEQCESHHIGEWVKDQGPSLGAHRYAGMIPDTALMVHKFRSESSLVGRALSNQNPPARTLTSATGVHHGGQTPRPRGWVGRFARGSTFSQNE